MAGFQTAEFVVTTIVEAHEVTKYYDGVAALDNLDLSISRGRPVGLVGPNGAGKTTLFSLMAGFVRPTSGRLSIFGNSPGHRELCGRIAILPQDAPFKSGVSIERQLAFFARLQGLSARLIKTEVVRVLELVGITDIAKKSPEQLSHGLFKRAAIAQSLIGEPELVLLDEPTAGLDPVAARAVRQMIKNQSGDITFMVSSHNLDEIQAICESVVLLDKGRLVKASRVDELVDAAQYLTITLAIAPPDNLDDRFADLEGVTQIETSCSDDNRIVIQFDSKQPDRFQIRVMEILSGAGIDVVSISRGKGFADSVVDMVTRPNIQN